MREINDQYPEYAPPTEKLKGRKHRKSGVNALPLCICAFFIAACFTAPLRSVSGPPESKPLPAALSLEENPETEKASEKRSDLSETDQAETAEVHETETEPVNETREETLPAETESIAGEPETASETSAATPETPPQTKATPKETIPLRPQETAAPLETLPAPSASEPESVPETVLQTAETAAETGVSVPESIPQEESQAAEESQSEPESFAEPESDFGDPARETESTEEPSGESMTAETAETGDTADYDLSGRPALRESDASGEIPSESAWDTDSVTGATEAETKESEVPDMAAVDPGDAGDTPTAAETAAVTVPAEEADIPAPTEFETEPVVWDDVP